MFIIGGIGFTSTDIGLMMIGGGLAVIVFTLFIYHHIGKKYFICFCADY